MSATLNTLQQMGAEINCHANNISLAMKQRPKAVNFCTAPYPGLATDMQAQLLAINTIATGSSVITEKIYENRFHACSRIS